MPFGKVIFFNKKSKFGFIKDNEENASYYVSEKQLIDRIEDGDEVEFDVRDAARGKEAIRVRKIPKASS